jgi:transcriptional regulator with XRE-family HTH domain
VDTIITKRHKRLVEILVAARKQKGVRQAELARATGKTQTFVTRFEAGQRRIDVIELLALCEIIGIDAVKLIRELLQIEGELWRPRKNRSRR